jgi:HAD superfamily hydrolase (TIGR01490 family)
VGSILKLGRAAFFDVDGTLTSENVWRGVMEYFLRRNLRRATHRLFWAYHTPLYLLHRMRVIPQSGFRVPWARHLPWYFRGYTEERGGEIWRWVVEDFLAQYWRPDTRAILDQHKASGDLVVLVSGGPAPLVRRIAEELGADYGIGTQPELRDGVYSGGVAGAVCLGENKPRLAKELLAAHSIKIDFEDSYAYADSPGDVPLLSMVGNSVAAHPDEHLRPIAEDRGWRIID